MAILGSWNAEVNKTETAPHLQTPDESRRWIQGIASTPSVRKEEDEGARGKPRPGLAWRGPHKRHLSCLKHLMCRGLGKRQTGPRGEYGRGPMTGWSWARVSVGSGPSQGVRWEGKRLLPLAVHTSAASSGQIHCDDKRCSIWSGLLRLPNSREKTHF